MVHWSLSLSLALVLWGSPVVEGHGTMITPLPRQPESVYWYQVGCMIGCDCSGGGKEDYPTLESVNCQTPANTSLTDPNVLTYNPNNLSVRGNWNEYMPWRYPGSSRPIDSCGIASGFLPDAKVQFPHQFADSAKNNRRLIEQGQKGTQLPEGPVTEWNAGSVVELSFYLVVNHGGGYQYRVCPKTASQMNEACFEANPLQFVDDNHLVTMDGQNEPIVIPATDVSTGVIPEGSSWRKIPLPACNCDSGSNCDSQTQRDFNVPYSSSTVNLDD